METLSPAACLAAHLPSENGCAKLSQAIIRCTQVYAEEREDIMSSDKLVLSVKEVAQRLGLSTDSVYDAVHRGQIPAVRLSQRGRILIPRVKLERMLDTVPATYFSESDRNSGASSL